MNNKYHIGLDIGTASIGWAVMDDNFKLFHKKGKTLIGTRLFTEGQTAKERRGFRTTRRRLARRKWRLKMLEQFFDEEMIKVDPYFFARLKDSNISPKDTNKKFHGTLIFPNDLVREAQFYEDYPTIYHLRAALMKEKDHKFDLREIYLAIHHINKYRGNFLSSGSAKHYTTSGSQLSEKFEEINRIYKEIGESIDRLKSNYTIENDKFDKLEELVYSDKEKAADKKKKLVSLLTIKGSNKDENKQLKNVATAMANSLLGYKFKPLDLFLDVQDKFEAITFNDEEIEEKFDQLSTILSDEQLSLIQTLQEIYFKVKLNEIVPNGLTLSESMIKKYEAHKKHLEMYKSLRDKVDEKTKKTLNEAYSGYIETSEKMTVDDFYSKVKKSCTKLNYPEAKEILQLIADGKFMPKQRTKENGVIPNQLHQIEMDQIIANQAKYYPFLAEANPIEKHRSSLPYKLDELLTFRVPYYVGPLVDNEQVGAVNSKFAWMVRKENKEITPWNFEEVVDTETTANKFIRRMTTKDTYLYTEDVLPAASLLYQKFTVLNELNGIRVNGEKLSSKEKQRVFEGLFTKTKSVSLTKLVNELDGNVKEEQVTGLSKTKKKFNSTYGSYIDLKKVIGDKVDTESIDDLEKILEYQTVFEDKNMLRNKLDEFDWLTEEQKNQLAKKHYTGWGRLSKKLLTQIPNENGENIINALWNGKQNFMTLVNDPYVKEQIDAENAKYIQDQSVDAVLDKAYSSPQNKKAIHQVLKVVHDIVKVMGNKPSSIAVEFTRKEDKKVETKTRYDQMSEIYSKITEEVFAEYNADKNELEDLLKSNESSMLDKYYLYFMQMGRDIYNPTQKIDIDNLQNYDIDHIIPQSVTKDDSIHNRVLTHRQLNNEKSDSLPLKMYGPKSRAFWKQLLDSGLISTIKYNNLTLEDPDKMDKYKQSGFIKRQLVETSQVVKLIANILNNEFGDDTNIIEVRAKLNSQVREYLGLIKNRRVNDYHHAVDAYLSTFVGQYLYKKYPKLRPYFIYGEYQKLSDKDIKNVTTFNFLKDLGDENVTDIRDNVNNEVFVNRLEIKEYLNKINNFKFMLISKEVSTKNGALYNQSKYRADSGKTLIPIKKGKDVNIYGGYSGNVDSYMMIAKLTDGKGNEYYNVVGVPRIISEKVEFLKKTDTLKYRELINEIAIKSFKTAKDKNNFDRIVVDKVRYGQLIVDEKNKFTLGSSKEKHNAVQLTLSDKTMETLVYENKKKADSAGISDDILDKRLNEVFDDITEKMDNYFELFRTETNKFKIFENKQKFYNLPVRTEKNEKGKFDIINMILDGLHANATRSNLKVIGASTEFGRLKKDVTTLSKNAKLIYQSPTGLFERVVYLKDL